MDIDVMSLENRVYLLSKGYMDIGNKVKRLGSRADINMTKTNKEMLLQYSLLCMR